ncbi:MAG: rhodanese-like domain-containing protein [Rhizobiales bacterium]|nr:rhodanese-like domain-containing protein [Hyphomicrobiales bacterium]
MTAAEAYELMTKDASAQLVDVRTHAEWTYVGAPDLAPLGRQTVFCEWQTYPSGQASPTFLADLDRALASASAAPDATLVFICRSGVRSRAAASVARAAGRARCVNVSDGFEGPLDADGRRGVISGWRASGLPWRQS